VIIGIERRGLSMRRIRVNRNNTWTEGLVGFIEIVLNLMNEDKKVDKIIKELKLTKYFKEKD
jgi:hypothetical protein